MVRGVASLAVALVAFVSGAAGARANGDRDVVLLQLCDHLISAQITDRADPDYGGLRCPSSNPEPHPVHSRAAEAVYPLAVAYQITGDERYRDAAIALGDWLIVIQQESGAWGESWPNHDGWTGTTADQLISLAGAYPSLEGGMDAKQRNTWQAAIRRAGDFVHARFPMGNLNYWVTGAVGLRLAERALESPDAAWPAHADRLVALTLEAANADGLLVGEGGGVDVGYNLAQTLGFLAMYGRLTEDESLLERTAELVRAHLPFVYPDGSIDNSWGTRSYKWTYESGTKTAPGVHFTFGLLADRDPRFLDAGRRALDYLRAHAMVEGWVVQGPHAERRASSYPPCIYGTFTRAQSLAMMRMYAPDGVSESDPRSGRADAWYRHYPTVDVAVVQTGALMATVSAYGEISKLPRTLVTRGGSLTHLWVGAFGSAGVLQTSSVTEYRRQEAKHQPDEEPLLPLTPRIEVWEDDAYWTNLYEDRAALTVEEVGDRVVIRASGRLRDRDGRDSGVTYQLEHDFDGSEVRKRARITSDRPLTVRMVEPVVRVEGLAVAGETRDRLRLTPGTGVPWTFAVTSSEDRFQLTHGEELDRYWCPFPGVEAYPLVVAVPVRPGRATELEVAFAPMEGTGGRE